MNRAGNPPYAFQLKGVGIGDPWTDASSQG